MKTLSETILEKIKPPADMASFAEVEAMLADASCITLCLASTFAFVREQIQRLGAAGVQGDVVLVGVWRGGLAAYLQALLVESGASPRRLVLCDTFRGFLPVGDDHPRDRRMYDYFATLTAPPGSQEEVLGRMREWGLPTSNVMVLEGDVRETTAGFDRDIALLLVDVDFYEPTRAALDNLHPRVVPGGCVYVDDYGVDEYECRQAVDDFLASAGISGRPAPVNRFAVSWRR